MSINLTMLRCFVAVAQSGSLSNAASALGRTPSAISMMLKQFEEHVGAQLFETTRKSRLTPLGLMIYEEARRGLSSFDNTVSIMEGLSRSEIGFLRLAVTPSVANTFLPSIVGSFLETHGQVQLDIRDMNSAAIESELRAERVDIGIGTIPEIESMRRMELFSDRFGVVCRKDAPFVQEWDQLTWQDMREQTLISNGLSDMITDPDFLPILATSRLNVPNTTTLLSLVREAVGITVLPEMAATDLRDDLVFLPLSDVSARRTVHLVSQRGERLMPAARAFVAQIEAAKANGFLCLTSAPGGQI